MSESNRRFARQRGKHEGLPRRPAGDAPLGWVAYALPSK
jgi:hypothetical protein